MNTKWFTNKIEKHNPNDMENNENAIQKIESASEIMKK